MGKLEGVSFYNKAYSEPKYGYSKHYTKSVYYPAWETVIKMIKTHIKLDNPRILEIGCGTGQFANMLFDNGYTNYIGFDYSSKAIELAKKVNVKHFSKFYCLDVYKTDIHKINNYDVVVCLETLEHLENDIQVLKDIHPYIPVIFSVPDFDSESHVRMFKNCREIEKRYGSILELKECKNHKIGEAGTLFVNFSKI